MDRSPTSVRAVFHVMSACICDRALYELPAEPEAGQRDGVTRIVWIEEMWAERIIGRSWDVKKEGAREL